MISIMEISDRPAKPTEMEEEEVIAALDLEVVESDDSDGFLEQVTEVPSVLLQPGSPEQAHGLNSSESVLTSTVLRSEPSTSAGGTRVTKARRARRLTKKAESGPETAEKALPATVAAACLTHLQTLRNENLQRHDQVNYSCMSFAEQLRSLPLKERQRAIFEIQDLLHRKVMANIPE
ncbi:uncharacterized protein LOC144167108 [Haemaphysalis longicornis]